MKQKTKIKAANTIKEPDNKNCMLSGSDFIYSCFPLLNSFSNWRIVIGL